MTPVPYTKDHDAFLSSLIRRNIFSRVPDEAATKAAPVEPKPDAALLVSALEVDIE